MGVYQTELQGLSNTGVNRPKKITAKSQLMQNYTVPVELAQGFDEVTTGQQAQSNADPITHLFCIQRDTGGISRYSPNNVNRSNWQKTDWSIAGESAGRIATGIDSTGTLQVFAVTVQGHVWRRSLVETGWTKLCELTEGAIHLRLATGTINGELALAVSYRKENDKSRAWWVDWKSGEKTAATYKTHYIYDIAIGSCPVNGANKEGLFTSWRNTSSADGGIRFFQQGDSQNYTSYSDTGDHHYDQLEVSPEGAGQLFGVRSDGHLHFFPSPTANKQRLLSNYDSKQIQLVKAGLQASEAASQHADQARLQLFVVDDDHQLLHIWQQGSSAWSDAIAIGQNMRRTACCITDGFPDLYGLSTHSTNAVLQHFEITPLTDDWRRSPISTPLPPSTSNIDGQHEVTVGLDQHSSYGNASQNVLLWHKTEAAIDRYLPSEEYPGIWVQEDWSLPQGKLPLTMIATQGTDGRLVVWAISQSNEVMLRGAGDSSWQNWGRCPYGQAVQLTACPYRGESHDALCFVLCNLDNGTDRIFDLSKRGEEIRWGWSSEISPNISALSQGYFTYDNALIQGIYVALTEDDGKQRIKFYAAGNPSDLKWCSLGQTSSHQYNQLAASIINPGDVFALRDDAKLILFKQNGQTDVPFGDAERIEEFCVGRGPSGSQFLFARTDKNKIKQCQQNANGSWSSPSTITTSSRAIGIAQAPLTTAESFIAPQLFDLDSTHKRLRLSQQSDSSWSTANVKQASGQSAPMTEVRSYSTEISVGDLNCTPCANIEIQFRPNNMEADFVINGISYRLDPLDAPLRLVTNANGKATFTVFASTLATPQLNIWSNDFIPERDSLLIEADGGVQSTLATISRQQLKSAKKTASDGSQQPLFSDSSVVTSDFTNSINEVMSMAGDDAEAAVSRNDGADWLCRSSYSQTSRVVPRASAHQHAAMLCGANTDRHFVINFGTRLRFQKLDRSTAQKQMASAKNAADNFFSGTFGDIMRAAINQQSPLQSYDPTPNSNVQLKQVVISRRGTTQFGVFDGIKDLFEASVSFIVDGIEYIWDGIVHLVQEAFDFVEAIFASVEVMFEDIFAWLGDLFLWGDILKVQRLVKWLMQSNLQSVPNALLAVEDKIAEVVNQLRDVDYSNAGNQLGLANTSVNSAVAQANESSHNNALDTDTPQGNWLLNQFNELLDSFDFTLVLADAIETAITNLLSDLQRIFTDDLVAPIQAQLEALVQLINEQQGNLTFSQLLDATLGALAGSVNALITAIGDLAVAGLDAIATIAQGFVDMLNTELHIPFLSDLYSEVINPGQVLTIVDLLSLFVAIPGTLGYKLTMATLGRTVSIPDVPTTTFVAGQDMQKSRGRRTSKQVVLAADNSNYDDIAHVLDYVFSIGSGALGAVGFALALVDDTSESLEAVLSVTQGTPQKVQYIGAFCGAAATAIGCPSYPWEWERIQSDNRSGLTTEGAEMLVWLSEWVPVIAHLIAATESDSKSISKLCQTAETVYGVGHLFANIVIIVRKFNNLTSQSHPSGTEIASFTIGSIQDVLVPISEITALPKPFAIQGAAKAALGATSETGPLAIAIGVGAGLAVGAVIDLVVVAIPAALDIANVGVLIAEDVTG